MSRAVLLGDSIFDNIRYVPGGPAVIEQVRRSLPRGWRADLLARDGAITSDVQGQLGGLPDDSTHLVVSAGGNDALGHASMILHEPAESFHEVLLRMAAIREQFEHDYQEMLQRVLRSGKPTTVCTIYDAIPGLSDSERIGLCVFNDVILREAFRNRLPVIDLRLICTEASDYASSSPIEPSVSGGGKIARAISRVVTEHDFQGASRVFASA